MRYVCYNEYFATGEGRTVWLSLETGKAKEAKAAHIERFKVDPYFHSGIATISVTKRNWNRILTIMKPHFPEQFAAGVLDGRCHVQFGVYIHVNCS